MRIVIIGGGICGLGTALLLARDGHDVTVLERDSDPLPASPHDAWDAVRGSNRQIGDPFSACSAITASAGVVAYSTPFTTIGVA